MVPPFRYSSYLRLRYWQVFRYSPFCSSQNDSCFFLSWIFISIAMDMMFVVRELTP